LSGTDGFAGTEIGTLGLSFMYINQVIGSNTSTADLLTTLNTDSIFTVDVLNGGTYATGGNTLEFVLLDNIISGTAVDVFNFVGSGTIGISINAGLGTDLIV